MKTFLNCYTHLFKKMSMRYIPKHAIIKKMEITQLVLQVFIILSKPNKFISFMCD